MTGILTFFILIIGALFVYCLYKNKKALNIAKIIFCFLCAVGFLLLAITAEAYLFIGGTIIFIIIGIIGIKNFDDDL